MPRVSMPGAVGAAVMSALLMACAAPAAGPSASSMTKPTSSSAQSVAPWASATATPLPPTPEPTLPFVSWETILGGRRAYGPFAVRPDPAHPRDLLVDRDGRQVGHLSLLTLAAADWPGRLATVDDLLAFAANYVDQFRDTRLHDSPDSTFEAVGPEPLAVGAGTGVKYGWLWRDRSGNVERTINDIAILPGGIAWIQAVAGGVPGDLPWSSFADEGDMADLLPWLDQLVGEVRLPA